MTARIRISTAGLLLALAALPARADLHFGFDGDAQGWTVVDGGAMAWMPGGGNDGGFLQFTDLNSDDMRAVIGMGGADWSVYLAGTLSFDAKNLSGHTQFWNPFGEVLIMGAGGTSVLFDIAPDGQPANDGLWHTYHVQLNPAAFANVLGSVQSLSIKTEFAISDPGNAASFEVMGLDNVRLTAAVPEPETWALLVAGGVGLMLRRARATADAGGDAARAA